MLLPALLTAAFLAAHPDSLSGTWRITGDVMGNPLNEVCALTQTGTVIAGSCRATAPADAPAWAVTGEVKGASVTFSHGGDYEGTPLVIAYAGTLSSPAQIRGTVDVAPFSAGGTFSATQVPPAAAPATAPAKQ